VYRDPGVEHAAVLGRAFLSKVYLFVDYDNGVFKLGPLNQHSLDDNAVSSGICPGGGGFGGTNIALTVLGAVVFLLIVFLVWRWPKGCRKIKSHPPTPNGDEPGNQVVPVETPLPLAPLPQGPIED